MEVTETTTTEEVTETTTDVVQEQSTETVADTTTDTTTTTDTLLTDTTTESDWRGGFGEDDKLQNMLGRFTDQQAFGKAFMEAQAKLSERAGATIPGEDASETDRVNWNKARGIPEKADGYQIQYQAPEHLVEETDTAMLTALTEDFHGKGGLLADPVIMEAMHEKYYEIKEAQTQAFSADLETATRQNVDEIKTEMGSDFQVNQALAKAHLGTHSGLEESQLADMLSRTIIDENGKPVGRLGDQPWFMRMLAGSARASGEDMLFNQAGGHADGKSLDDQIKAIEAKRTGTADERAEYAELSKPGGQLRKLIKLQDAQKRNKRAA